jgi:transcriptional regulator with AAA-type ATPase domain
MLDVIYLFFSLNISGLPGNIKRLKNVDYRLCIMHRAPTSMGKEN